MFHMDWSKLILAVISMVFVGVLVHWNKVGESEAIPGVLALVAALAYNGQKSGSSDESK